MTLKDHSLTNTGTAPRLDLAEVVSRASEVEKLRIYKILQSELDLDANNINLTEALTIQLKLGQDFQENILTDPEVPANQRSQVFNSVNSSLEKIAKMRDKVMSQERLKRYESAFMKVVEHIKENDPGNAKQMLDIFMDLYGDYLNDRGT